MLASPFASLNYGYVDDSGPTNVAIGAICVRLAMSEMAR